MFDDKEKDGKKKKRQQVEEPGFNMVEERTY